MGVRKLGRGMSAGIQHVRELTRQRIDRNLLLRGSHICGFCMRKEFAQIDVNNRLEDSHQSRKYRGNVFLKTSGTSRI